MKRFCILEYPKKRNLSYIIYNEYFKRMGYNFNYESLSFKPEYFSKKIGEILKNYTGFNLTNPFKEKIIDFISLSPVVKIIKSANCVYNKTAYNTDWIGIRKSINFNLLNSPILIVGAGGVSRAFLYLFDKLKIDNIFVSNRTYNKLLTLKKDFPFITLLKFEDIHKKINTFKSLINATTVGINNDYFYFMDKIESVRYIYDVIYYETPLQIYAKNKGINFTCGKNMWYYQAMENLKIWGIYDEDVFKETFYKILGGLNENCPNAIRPSYR
jgi:shikimate dehydrogenase